MYSKNIPFLLSLFLLTLTASVQAQFGATHPIFPASLLNGGFSHHVIDMDNDGDNDLVFLREDRSLSLLRNDGTGHFAEGEIIIENAIEPPVFVDFNHDDLPDVLVRCGNLLCWAPNEGDGTFSNVFPIGAFGVFKIIDMNHDGEMDIFDGVNWLENEGGGIFIEQHEFYTPNTFQDVSVVDLVDLNADGLPDYVYRIGFNYDLTYWRAQEPGGGLSLTTNIIHAGSSFMQFFDLDYDGDMDLIDWDYLNWPNFIRSHLNDGSGNFGQPTQLYPCNSLYSISDVDGDGFADILLPANPNNFAWGKNDGNGNFTFQLTRVIASNDWQFTDISGDGYGDFVFKYGASLNDGAGGFGSVESYFTEVARIQGTTIADADGDGDPDVFFNDIEKREMGWFSNDGAGGFLVKNIVQTSFSGGLAVADFDADGYPDLAAANFDSLQLMWQGVPGGNYGVPDTLVRDLEQAFIWEMIDIDGDGDLDWHVFTNFQAPVYINAWMYNDGAGNFSIPTNPPYIGPVAYADIDGDGLLDIIVTSYSPTIETFWQKNLGNGDFGPQVSIALYFSTWVQGADLDNDGDMDLLAGVDLLVNGSTNHLNWLENQNNGSAWVEHQIAQVSSTVYCLGDFNQDGTTDICLGTAHNMSFDILDIAWYANDGAGNFSDPVFMKQLAGVKNLATSDLDQDGDLDVLYSGDSGLGWIENLAANPVINGICFFDANENGVQDGTESPLPGIKINLEPGGQTTFSAADGTFRFYASAGDFLLSAEPGDCFEGTTSPATFQIQLPLPTSDSLFAFGFKNQTSQPSMVAPISASPTRCSFNVPFWISLQNESCFPAGAVFSLKSNGLVSFVSAEPAPALVLGDSIVWLSGDSLQPGETRSIRALLKVAGPDYLGDTIHLTGYAWALDAAGNLLQPPVISHFASEINCAYDPNDKLVNRPQVPADYEPASSELTYTIRFQNFGTDTAFSVMILDTLAAELNWGTFRPLGASHSGTISLDAISRAVEFRFDNILLPDSAANEPASHGFISFSIQLEPDLPSGTSVSNTAAIYFDFNPPVFTNAVETKIESPSVATQERGQGWVVQMSPNPTFGELRLVFPDTVPKARYLQVLDLYGRLLQSEALRPGEQSHPFSVASLPAGMYFVRVMDGGVPVWAEKVVKQ